MSGLLFLVRRLGQALLTLLGVILLVFVLFNWVGGDPALILAGKMASAQDLANVRHQLGLDRPLWQQFLDFVGQVLRGDYGESWATHEPVSAIFRSRLGPSLTLLIPMLVLETLVAVAVALLVAALRGSWLDQGVRMVSTVAMSVSLLVYIIVGQYVFAYLWGWFPVKGWSDSVLTNLRVYALLPVITRQSPQDGPDERGHKSCDQSYPNRGLGPLEHLLPHIPSPFIRPEKQGQAIRHRLGLDPLRRGPRFAPDRFERIGPTIQRNDRTTIPGLPSRPGHPICGRGTPCRRCVIDGHRVIPARTQPPGQHHPYQHQITHHHAQGKTSHRVAP